VDIIDLITTKIEECNINIGIEIVCQPEKAHLIEKTACYDPVKKKIIINKQKLCEHLYKINEKSEQYIDVLIAHELGHAIDPHIEEAVAEYNDKRNSAHNLLVYFLSTQGQNTQVILKQLITLYTDLQSIDLLNEKRAWEFGARFTKYPKYFDGFNRENIKTHRTILNTLISSIENITSTIPSKLL
jgi:hypothetical protein